MRKASDKQFVPTEDQSKQLQKVKKWSSIVNECHNLINMSQENIDLLHTKLRNLKMLSQDIKQCRLALNELNSLGELKTTIKQLIESDAADLVDKISDLLQA